MEETDCWNIWGEEGGCDAEYTEVSGIFFESAVREIPVSSGVLVLGFDLLGELCMPSFLSSY
jgi:hypothetical protein